MTTPAPKHDVGEQITKAMQDFTVAIRPAIEAMATAVTQIAASLEQWRKSQEKDGAE